MKYAIYEKAQRSYQIGELRAIKAFSEYIQILQEEDNYEALKQWDKRYMDPFITRQNTKYFFAELMRRLARLSQYGFEKLYVVDKDRHKFLLNLMREVYTQKKDI